jgi:putative hemolysin
LRFNALYVTAEFATVGARRSRVQEAADNGSAAAARLLVILRDATKLDNYVAACQVGITLTSLVAGAYGQAQITPALEPLFGKGSRGAAIIVVLVAITALQVVLGELLPKTAALRYPERLAMLVMPAIQVSQLVFRPFVALFNGSAFRLMRLMNLNGGGGHGQVHSARNSLASTAQAPLAG